MTHLAAAIVGVALGAVTTYTVAAVYLSGDRQAAIADRDSALDALAREQSLRLYAERSLDHWLDQAARLEKAARR